MNIVLCSEGAWLKSGGMGLVAVPDIARALAELGHRVVLETFGPPIPGSESFLASDPARAFQDTLVAIRYPASGRYSFSRTGFQHVMEHAARADFVMLHSLYSFAVLSGYFAARRHGKKYGLWPHGVLAPFQRTVSAKKKAVYDRLLARRILEQAAVLFYNAVGERDEAAPLHLTAPSVIIPHGIEVEPFAHMPPRGAFRAKYLNGFDGALLLYLGRLNAKKGLDVLIHAMRRVAARAPDTRLAIVGAGDPPEYANQVRSWIRENGLEDFTVMSGLLLGRDKLQALADADVFVLPSHAENFSFAMFEAMAARIPVVISDTLNLAPEVERCGAGCVVAREPAAFANAILALLASPETRRTMGEQGAQLAARYSWSAVGKEMERTILALVQNQPLPRDLMMGQHFSIES